MKRAAVGNGGRGLCDGLGPGGQAGVDTGGRLASGIHAGRGGATSSGHLELNRALLKTGQDMCGADLTSRRVLLAVIGAEQATP